MHVFIICSWLFINHIYGKVTYDGLLTSSMVTVRVNGFPSPTSLRTKMRIRNVVLGRRCSTRIMSSSRKISSNMQSLNWYKMMQSMKKECFVYKHNLVKMDNKYQIPVQMRWNVNTQTYLYRVILEKVQGWHVQSIRLAISRPKV